VIITGATAAAVSQQEPQHVSLWLIPCPFLRDEMQRDIAYFLKQH